MVSILEEAAGDITWPRDGFANFVKVKSVKNKPTIKIYLFFRFYKTDSVKFTEFQILDSSTSQEVLCQWPPNWNTSYLFITRYWVRFCSISLKVEMQGIFEKRSWIFDLRFSSLAFLVVLKNWFKPFFHLLEK